VQTRAARIGFDWPDLAPVLAKLQEELEEFRNAMDACPVDAPVASQDAKDHLQAELGDVLFTIVNVSRFLKINPEEALRTTINRFIDRFQSVETQAAALGRPLGQMTLQEMDELWTEAKRQVRHPEKS
jgi:tetrapyrrole methylase family protein/MazG family protein